MLNVPSQAFPAPGSQQRAASGGRSKVPLKQGRSLMDWIRLTKSGKDLTGLKGRLIEVTEEELIKHNKKDDCWVCIRGYVYNVTPYMEYHPGGEDELMRAAGSDGTDLFDQVHRWVNYESMLKECLVGRMAVKPVAVVKGFYVTAAFVLYNPFFYCRNAPPGWRLPNLRKCLVCRVFLESHEEKKLLNGILPKSHASDLPAKEISPRDGRQRGARLDESLFARPLGLTDVGSSRYDWFQTESLVTIVIYTKQKDIDLESVIVDNQVGSFRAEIIIKDYSYILHTELSHEIQEDITVRVAEKTGKVEIVLKKKDSVSWKYLGHPLENHNTFTANRDTAEPRAAESTEPRAQTAAHAPNSLPPPARSSSRARAPSTMANWNTCIIRLMVDGTYQEAAIGFQDSLFYSTWENLHQYSSVRGLFYRKCQLISKVDVTHDTKLYCLMLPPGTHLQVPIGQHVYLKQTVAGTEIVKPYTPVLESLHLDLQESHNKYIYFMIKIYHAGLFTPHFDCLQIGDCVSLSSPEGNFKQSQLQELEELFLVAAGTGFTPMIKILNHALTNITSLRKVKLMFFNKTEGDILWRNQLEQLADQEKRFEVQFILSEPTCEWTGKQGRISLPLLSEFVKRSSEDSRVLICICGPAPFTEQGLRLLKDLNFSQEEVHSFTA